MPQPSSAASWSALDGSRRSIIIELALVLALFCAPLFMGLRGWDLHSDESIYSYAVDRILDTGEWLTPRTIPYDQPFLEKPPLKFWIVAGAIDSGLLPRDEFGLRFFDALFGGIAFVYVFLFGRWIGGPGCGFIATLMLFTIDSLLFEHGLRSNNMESALFLSYCGGLYHFARWAEGSERAKAHAVAFAAFFALGFMTKFVAVLFLPLTAAVAFLWRRDAWSQLRWRWGEWVIPGALAGLVIAPWFVYQIAIGGDQVWKEMFGLHVYERFTAALDPRHVQPWYYYVVRTRDELRFAKSLWVAVAGVVMLAAKAWTGQPWTARLLLVWLLLPYALISIPGSKVIHYAYPFFPPFALGAAWFAVTVFRGVDRALARALDQALPWFRRAVPPLLGQGLLAVALLLLGVSIWTSATGPFSWEIARLEVTNSSVARPAIMAAILLALAGMPAIRRVAAMAVVALILPVWTYPLQAKHVMSVGRPLQALRDCARSLPASQRETRVFVPYGRLLNHSFYYYARQIGRWTETDRVDHDELARRLHKPGEQTLVIVAKSDYDQLSSKTGFVTPGVGLLDDVILLTPGPLEACSHAALIAGGTPIGGDFPIMMRHLP